MIEGDLDMLFQLYSTLSDEELDRIVTVASHISLGHRIQQTRIRESLMRVDPEGIVSR